MSSPQNDGGPYVLIDIASRKPVLAGDVRESIRTNDALRWQATLIAIEAPKLGSPHGKVTIVYDDGYQVIVNPSFIGAEFIPISNLQDNTSQEK
jgi:hypothetical protein